MKIRIFILLLLRGIGVMFFISVASDWWLLHRSQSWPAIDASIKSSEVMARRGKGGTFYHPIITYEYVFDRIRYSATTVRFGPEESIRDREEAESIVAAFPPESQVSAYVDPMLPNHSVLDRTHLNSEIMKVFAGIMSIFASFIRPRAESNDD